MKRSLWGGWGNAVPPPSPPKTPFPTPFLKGLGVGVWGRGLGPLATSPTTNFSEQNSQGEF